LWWSGPEASGLPKRAHGSEGGRGGFIYSEKLHEILKEASVDERQKVAKLLEKVAPAGRSILP